MDAQILPSQRKRVHFSHEEPDPDDAPREKRPRFPKGKKESQVSERMLDVVTGEEEEGPIKSTDPRVAANERAVRRSKFDEQLRKLDDTSLPTDILGAEEEYQQDDAEDEEDGILLDPFNLKREREEGYFDAEGNYVEYINDNDVKDAWLDSAEVDTGLAAKHMKKYKEEAVELNLSTKEVAGIKRRIADALQPGETVLHALRRLKQTSTERDKHSRARMSSQTKATFDMLTEDAMKLLDHGEYNVYDETKETFLREAEGYESLVKARSDPLTLAMNENASSQSSRYHEDIFGADGDDLTTSQVNRSAPEKTGGAVMGSEINRPSMNLLQGSTDMFADDDNDAGTSVINDLEASQGETHEGESGYVYDESSGYYYNSALGYYYDSSSELFCSAASGKWFRFDEGSNAYVEVVEEQEGEGQS